MKKSTVSNKKIAKLVALDRKVGCLPAIPPYEQQMLDQEQAFKAVYHSNKLEGNKLSEEEARRAILIDK
jgi:hypothetical protein